VTDVSRKNSVNGDDGLLHFEYFSLCFISIHLWKHKIMKYPAAQTSPSDKQQGIFIISQKAVPLGNDPIGHPFYLDSCE
jgi:hypothetical protein